MTKDLWQRTSIYSLRKFKGVGLASAIVGTMVFSAGLSSQVMAAETDSTDSNAVSKPTDGHTAPHESGRIVIANETNPVTKPTTETTNMGGGTTGIPTNDTREATTSTERAAVEPNPVVTERNSNPVAIANDTATDSHVSEKAKEVVRELNDTLVMKKEDTASTSDTLFKLDEGLKVTEEEKAYVKAITDSFNDMPEVVRSSVNSLTFVRKPNGNYGYTYSESGDVNMNMQYYHPELTHGEPGSLQQSVGVLGHEVGHIFNAKSFRDNKEWSFSRDPKYAELAKEVYGDSMTDNIHGRWTSDFGSYVGWISGKSTPQTEGDHKIYEYMDSLFRGILTPREDRITPELKSAVETAKAGGKRLVYDGHVSLDATYKNVDSVQSHVDELNRAEIKKVAGISDAGHFKTYGINKLVTTRYTSNNSDISVPVIGKQDAGNLDKPGYDFVDKVVTNDGLLVEYKYRLQTTLSLDNDKVAGDLDIQKTNVGIGGSNKASLRFTVKEPTNDFKIKYLIENLTTGSFQGDKNSAYVVSSNLNGKTKYDRGDHLLGSVEAGYNALADLQFDVLDGTFGQNTYRMTAIFLDGNKELGRVHKDFTTNVATLKENSLAGIEALSQVRDGSDNVSAIIKDGKIYRSQVDIIGYISADTKSANNEVIKHTPRHPNDIISKSARVRYTVLHPEYRLQNVNTASIQRLSEVRDSDNQSKLLFWASNHEMTKDELGIKSLTYNANSSHGGVLYDTAMSLQYTGVDMSNRVDKVPVKIELLDVIDGKETVLSSRTETLNLKVVDYKESLRDNFATDFSISRIASIGSATNRNGQFSYDNATIYGTDLNHTKLWSYGNYNENQENRIKQFNFQDVSDNKRVLLESLVGFNIKKPITGVFSDVDYTVKMDVFNRKDGQPLNFDEIVLNTSTAQNGVLTGEYNETVYWVDAQGARHKLGSNISETNKQFASKYIIPNEARGVEVDIQGKVPANYVADYLMQYVARDTIKQLDAENRVLGISEPFNIDNRGFTSHIKVTDNLLSKVRDFDVETIAKRKNRIAVADNLNTYGLNLNNAMVGTTYRLGSDIQSRPSSDTNLTSTGFLPTNGLLDPSVPLKQVVLMQEGVAPTNGIWNKHSMIEHGGVNYTIYTRDIAIENVNDADFNLNYFVKPNVDSLIADKKYRVYTGLVYGVDLTKTDSDSNHDGGTMAFTSAPGAPTRLDRQVLAALGHTSQNDLGNTARIASRLVEFTVRRSQEFTVNQTIEENDMVTKDYATASGKTVDIKVSLANGAQTTNPRLEVIQNVPKGDLGVEFVDVKPNDKYTVYYTSDETVSSASAWTTQKPTKVTGVKWVRKEALPTGTFEQVGYTVRVSNESTSKSSIAKAEMLNGELRATTNDVILRSNRQFKKLSVKVVYVDEHGNVLEANDNSLVDVPVGEEHKYLDYIPQHFLSSVENKSATYESDGVQLPTGKIDWSKATFVGLDKDSTITFKFVRNQNQEDNVRKQYTTTWNNGYVEPPVSELINLFPNVRAAKYLENESTQAVKAFEIIYNNGFKGKGFVDVTIMPKREKVVGINKSIDYRGDEDKDFGYRSTEEGVNPSHDIVKSYTADSNGIFHESVTTENDVPARNAIVTLGTKPTVKTETITKGKRYEADPDQAVKGQETVVEGQDGVKTSTTRYTVNPTTGDITSNTTVENTEKVDTVVKVGNKEVLTEPIAMTTRYKAEPSLEKDVQETESTGRAGSREITVTYDVNPSDGTLSNPTRTTRETESMTPTVIKVGSVHKDVVETEITSKYISDDTKVRDSREEISAGSKGVKTTTTTYEVDENTGATYSPTTQVDDQPMVQRVVKIGTKPIVDVETIAITTKYIFDENLAYGQQIVEEKGSEGRVVTTTTYTMNESDGTTSADAPDVQTVPMVQRVIRIGVKPTVEETPINFNTFYESDPTADKDSRVDKVAGKVGKVITTTTYTYDSNTGVVTPNPSTSQTEDAVDRIVKVGTRPNVVETPIKFTTTYEADPESQRDSKVDKVVGKNGTTTVTTTYSVDPKTGVITENPSVTTTKDPVNAVIKVGTKSTEVVETLPSPKRFVKDPTRPKDEEPLTEHGETGSKTTITTYSLNPITGVTAESVRHWMVVGPTDTIVRVPAGDKVVEEKIAITTRYIEDPTKDFGYEEEISKGSEGKIVTTTTYNVDGQTGDVTEGGTNQVRTDMVQRVVRKGTKPKVVETPIHFTTRYEKDGTKPKGENTDFVNGVPGKTITTTTYTLDPDTGKVTENPSTSTTEEPVTKVVKVGAKDTIEVTPIELVTRYERDDDLMVGKSTIVNAGKAGSITTTTTYDVNPTTGDVIESGKTSITDDMVEKVVKVGTKPSVLVDTHPINVRYVPKEDIDYGVRTVKSEGSSTVITSTTNYVLNPDGSTTASTPVVTTVDGSDRVIEVGVKTSSVTIELPYDVETKYDSNLEAGQTVVDQNGENGSKTIVTTYSLNETTGDVTSNTNETSVQPKPKKVRIGTGVRSTNVRHIIHNIQFETETIVDRFLPKGKEVVENEGTLGKDIETIVEQLFNGEVRTSDSSTQRVLDPVKRVVRIGIYEFAKPIENLTIEPEEFNGGVNPNDAPVVEIPEFNGGVIPNEAPTYDKPEFNGGVNPNDAPVVEIPEFNGGVTPNEVPTYDKPEFNGGVNPNDAPVVEIPEFNGGVTPNEAPTYDKPEFNGGVNPNDAPVVEIPEFNGGVTPNEAPVVEIPTTTLNEVSVVETPATTANARQLPNTGESGNSLVSGAIGTIIGLLGLGLARKRED